jgi:uncharacterized membrane protein
MWMGSLLGSPVKSLLLGVAASVLLLAIALAGSGIDGIGLVALLTRWLHVGAGIIWVGMIWFVNFIQLVAIAEADQPARGAILKHVVPRVATTFRHTSHLTVASGVVLLFTSGYLGGSLIYSSAVFIPTSRNILMWVGTVAALAMYMFVHMMIWPGLRVVLGIEKADADAVAAARAKVATYARWNLVLSVVVTLAMVAAAHA